MTETAGFRGTSTVESSDVLKQSILGAPDVPAQPTVRLWLVGNPVSGHGKGEQHLAALRKAIQSKLRSYNPSLGTSKVKAPLWYASDFLKAASFENAHLGENLNTLFRPESHSQHSSKKPKHNSFQKEKEHEEVFSALPSFSESPTPNLTPNPQPAQRELSISSGIVAASVSPTPADTPPSGMVNSSSTINSRMGSKTSRSTIERFEGPAINALVVYTQVANDGHKLLERITEMVVHDQLRSLQVHQRNVYRQREKISKANEKSEELKNLSMSTNGDSVTPNPSLCREEPLTSSPDVAYVYPYLDVMAMVGGDGTLSEGVNGVCHGILKAYENWMRAFAAVVQEFKDSEDSEYEMMKKVKRVIQLHVEGVAWNAVRKEEVLAEQHTIRRLAPFILYSPSGTGADFARLGICCPRVSDFVKVVQGVAGSFFYTYNNRRSSGGSKIMDSMSSTNGKKVCSQTAVESKSLIPGSSNGVSVKTSESSPYDGSFAATSVDVGRISFPKTKNVKYFINECSMGMSVEVIQRTNRFRRKALLAALGGTIIFGSSSFVSLVKMAPSWIRMMRLPSRLDPKGPVCDFYIEENGTRSINPLYLHLPTMNADLKKSAKGILKKTRLTEGDPGSPVAPIEASVTTENIVHRICMGTDDIREELDLVPPSSPDSSLHAEDTFAPISIESTKEFMEENLEAESVDTSPRRWAYILSSTVAFGNGRWYGGGMKVTPHGDPSDHLLSVTNWLTSFWTFLLGIMQLYSGDHQDWESTSTFDGERFLLDSGPQKPKNKGNTKDDSVDEERGAKTMLMEADGELLEPLPAIIEIGGYITMLSPAATPAKGGARLRIGQPIRGTSRYAVQQARGEDIPDNSFSTSVDARRVENLIVAYSTEEERLNESCNDTSRSGRLASLLGGVGRHIRRVGSGVAAGVRSATTSAFSPSRPDFLDGDPEESEKEDEEFMALHTSESMLHSERSAPI